MCSSSTNIQQRRKCMFVLYFAIFFCMLSELYRDTVNSNCLAVCFLTVGFFRSWWLAAWTEAAGVTSSWLWLTAGGDGHQWVSGCHTEFITLWHKLSPLLRGNPSLGPCRIMECTCCRCTGEQWAISPLRSGQLWYPSSGSPAVGVRKWHLIFFGWVTRQLLGNKASSGLDICW